MTNEEKITHIRTAAMEEARAEANAIVKQHEDALRSVFEQHQIEARRQSETRVRAESVTAKQQLNMAMSKAQLELKREMGKTQTELKTELFEEVQLKLLAFMRTEEYKEVLIRYIEKAAQFASGMAMTIYINPSDADKKTYLEAENGSSAILEASSHHPDIALLDLGLPDIEGVEVIKKIRTWSNMPIIVISARSEDADKIEALDAGADDYITKPFSVEELLARIRVTQRRLAIIQTGEQPETSVFENGELKIDYTAGCTYLKGEELHLTPIEYKLLCLLSRNVGKVLTHTYITQQIWGRCSENDIASLRVFMATLRKKLEPEKNEVQYIQTHIGIGYRMLRIEKDK